MISQFFLQKIARLLKRSVIHISDDAQKMLINYDWPGNMRELYNTIERAVILCEGDTIELKHLACEMMKNNVETSINQPSLNDLKDTSLKIYVDQIEKSILTQALQISSGNQLKAAKILGEPRHIVRYLIKKHNINGDK